MNRYTTNGEEGEILPNLLGITDEETLHNAEFEGFLMAEILFTEKLTPKTKFSVKYICDIHRMALKELYSFAGHFRSVNISKGVPSRKRNVLRISFGITTRPRSSILLTIPVAFITFIPPAYHKTSLFPYCVSYG